MNEDCERIIRELAAGETCLSSETVAFVLYLRYLKRVSAHLSNVVSSVINPFERIGYYGDKTEIP